MSPPISATSKITRFLEAYWHNYVLDPAGPHFLEVVRSAALASRVDLRTMLERIDVVSLARNTEEQCRALLNVDTDIDVVLMVGVGAANAGELVVDGKGIAFVCLEHFTRLPTRDSGLGARSRANPSVSSRVATRSAHLPTAGAS